MVQRRDAFRLILSLLCNAVSSRASKAAPILLAEYRHTQPALFYDWRNPTLPDGVPFFFRVGATGAGGGEWVQHIRQSHIGQTVSANPEIIDLFDDPLTQPNPFVSGRIGANAIDWFASVDYWIHKEPEVPPLDHTFVVHVADLAAYRLTGLTRTVDSLTFEWIQEGRAYRAGGGQTIRLLGELIPEPWSILLLFAAFCSGFLLRLPHSPPTGSCRVR